MSKFSLQLKISAIVIATITISVITAVYYAVRREEADLLREKEKAGAMMARPILHTIYSDMLDERAEMVYYLVKGLKDMDGVERVQIIRWDGVETAFTDDKTLKEVETEHKELKPQWLTPRITLGKSESAGVRHQKFKAAFQEMKNNPQTARAAWYTEEFEGKKLFTYIVPIEEKEKCKGCHKAGGGRGVLMITTSLEDTYEALRASRNRWVISGIGTIGILSITIIMLIRAKVVRHIEALSQAARRIAGGDLSARVEARSGDEIGILADMMNDMAARLQIAHSSLESRVEIRTEELREANKELMAANEELQATYSQLEATTADLEEANEEMKGMEGLKTEFLQTVSHELRSPLTPLLGYLEMMRDGYLLELTGKQREVVDDMYVCGKNMQLLIDELLEAASIQAGRLYIEFEEVDICQVLRGSINGVRKYADTNRMELEVRIPYCPLPVEGDRRRLAEIFTHILRNAVKFNHEWGKVFVKAEATDNGVEVSVSDTGVGMPKERLERIFEAFYQAESSSTRRYQGIGLGLFLVKRLVDAHGGKIEVKSEVGAGTTFTIFIPRKRSMRQSGAANNEI